MAEYADKLMVSLKEAMRNKETDRRNTIRLLQAAFKQVAIDEQRDLTTEDELKILQKEAKKRRESISEYEEAGRDEMAADEKAELVLIEEFLPEQMSREEIEKIAKEAIEQTGASEPSDMGKVMGVVMGKTKGLADGGTVSQVVRELLSN